MQGRSWMAALTLAAGVLAIDVGLAARADDKPPTNRVRVHLLIAGLSRQGCDVEIKPGNAGSQFRPVSLHVGSNGKMSLILDDVVSTSADRGCAFAITIREPGRDVRTVRRFLRLGPDPEKVPSLSCMVNSPSKLARAEQMRERR